MDVYGRPELPGDPCDACGEPLYIVDELLRCSSCGWWVPSGCSLPAY